MQCNTWPRLSEPLPDPWLDPFDSLLRPQSAQADVVAAGLQARIHSPALLTSICRGLLEYPQLTPGRDEPRDFSPRPTPTPTPTTLRQLPNAKQYET